MKEISLVLFTLSAQTAAGAYCTLAALQTARSQNAADATRLFGVPALLILSLLLALGLAAAFFHLGMPLRGYRGLANVRSSWLSRELLAFSLFGLLVALHTGLALFLPALPTPPVLIYLAAASGICLVYVMSRAYRLRTVPAWNNNATTQAFFAASFMLGSLLALTLLGLQHGALPAETGWVIGFFILCGAADVLAERQRHQSKPQPRLYGDIRQQVPPAANLQWLHLGLLNLAMGLACLAAWLSSPALLAPTFLLAAVSQTASRLIFYQEGLGARG